MPSLVALRTIMKEARRREKHRLKNHSKMIKIFNEMFEIKIYINHPAMTLMKGSLLGGYRAKGVVVEGGNPSDWLRQINITDKKLIF
jgi:hypothetical protein